MSAAVTYMVHTFASISKQGTFCGCIINDIASCTLPAMLGFSLVTTLSKATIAVANTTS